MKKFKPQAAYLHAPTSLRQRMLLVIILAFFLTISIQIISVIAFVYRSESQAWRGRQLEAVQIGSEIVASFFQEFENTLEIVGSLYTSQAVKVDDALQLGIDQSESLLEIGILDLHGNVVAAMARDETSFIKSFATDLNPEDLPNQLGTTYFSDLNSSPDGQYYLVFYMPLANGQIVAGRLSMQELTSEVRKIRLGETGSVFILDTRGFTLTRNDVDIAKNNSSMQVLPTPDNLFASDDTVVQDRYLNFSGQQVIGMSAGIPGTNWGIVGEIPEQEVYSISRNAIVFLTIITASLWLIASMVSVYLFNRMFFQPIRALREGADRIGDGLLSHQVQVYRPDEIGWVAMAFNTMVYRLRQREEELRSQTQKLIEEVEGRRKAQSEAQRRLVEQLALQEASMSLITVLDSTEMLNRIAEQICKALDATSVYIMELDIESKQSVVVAEYFAAGACELERVSDLNVIYTEENVEFIDAMQSQTIWEDRIDQYPPDDEMYLHLLKFGGKSRLFVPLQMRGKVIGFAEIWESRCIREFSQDEINLCKAIAQNAAIGLENNRLYQETKLQLAERERAETALRELNEQLEQHVGLRTSELQAANELLKQEIRERKQIEASLRRSEERYSLAARGANDGLWDWDLVSKKVYYSPRWKAMLGYDEIAVMDEPTEWLNRIHPDDFSSVQVELNAHLDGITPQFESEHRMLHRDGSYRWMLTRGLAVRDEAGVAYRFAGSQTDITERKRAEHQLSHDALHDTLTGLPNRVLFLDRLDRALEIARRRDDYLFAVLFLDTDRFKLINDSLGHAIGDELLVAISKRLQTSLRETDTVARLGGDEFVILLEDIEEAPEAIKVAERVQNKFTRPFSIDGHEIYISISMGIILNDPSYERSTDVLGDADIAMYRAKAQGRAQYVIFEPKMRTSVMARLQIENDLRRALENGEFCLHYQPIISLDNSSLIGFEALVRWQHPEAGIIPPAEFIPIAEESGLILPLGQWILIEACRQMRLWQERYPDYATLSVSVNLSSLQFRQLDLAEQIEVVLNETGLNPQYLKLEITESLILEDAQSIHTTIQKLNSLGVQVFIDDFGTGYSSLGYLQKFPIDTIKIDRSFVQRIDLNGENGDLVRAILNLAKELKLNVIAEGIETEKQVNQLRALACQYGQGFYFSKPIESHRVEMLFSTNLLIPEFKYSFPAENN